jgi:hypothetical protein
METEKKVPTDYKLLIEVLIKDIERKMKQHDTDIELHSKYAVLGGKVHQEYYERHQALKEQLQDILNTINLYIR